MRALIEARELADVLGSVKILDATYGVPDAAAAFARGHIGQAQIFDIDAVADADAPYPHTMPSAEVFGAAVGALGISMEDDVIVYDQTGISFAAARAWWMFRAMGHQKVRVLNGGLSAWQRAGLPMETGPALPVTPAVYDAVFQPGLLRDFDAMEAGGDTVIDARAAPRFHAAMHGPDGDVVPAHIPGSGNLPFAALLDPFGALKSPQENATVLAPWQSSPRLVATCGSGVTACVVALALHEAGRSDVAIYDGSWTEWADRQGLR